ncbi:MAG: hypothetical protein P8Y42_00385 [Exilibacterium sp.]
MPKVPLFETLSDLLPHREPMILLDAVHDWGESYLEAVVEHKQPGIFTNAAGEVPAWVGVEYMAQAIGAWAGIRARSNDQPIRIGFLLGTRKYTSYTEAFNFGEKVVVRVEKLMMDNENLALFDCKIFADKILATAQIKAIQPQNIEAILGENRLS